MPETIALNAEVRNEVGTKHAARLRRAGKLPAIIYGHGREPVAVSLDLHNFAEMLHHGHRLFGVKIGKTLETLLIKDLQYDHLGKDIIHVDLVRVDLAEMVKVTVPIELKGTAKGTHEGGIVDEHLDHLEIECKASDIPEVIPVSVKELGVGDAIHAGDVELPEGMKLATDPETLVLMCHLVAAAKSTEELEEEMPVAPEVITEKVDQEGKDESK
jgi:large subunit ribosomal protein L25